MTIYTVGFLFDETKENVVLIRKNKPGWQNGLLNAVGGKFEEKDLTLKDCMVREFFEETGLLTEVSEWRLFMKMDTEHNSIVYFFKANSNRAKYCHSVTDEEVCFVRYEQVMQGDYSVIPNLRWILPMAQDENVIRVSSYCK